MKIKSIIIEKNKVSLIDQIINESLSSEFVINDIIVSETVSVYIVFIKYSEDNNVKRINGNSGIEATKAKTVRKRVK